MPPTVEARTADRAIACLRKAIDEREISPHVHATK